MAFLFHRKPAGINTKYSGMRTTSSLFGMPLPIIFGQNRISGKLFWYGDFIANKAKNQGKKGGGGGSGFGGKAGINYVYTASVLIGLAQGNCSALQSVWDSNGKFIVRSVTETFVVPGGGGTHQVSNNTNYSADQGVGHSAGYSITVNDYGSPGSTTLTGTQVTPFTQVAGSPGTGQYSVNPATGVYTFGAGDAGKTVQISYSYFVFDLISNELSIVPTSGPFQVTVEHQPYFTKDFGVTFYPSGIALSAVGGTPTASGTYNPNGGTYKFAAVDSGKGVVINYQWNEVNTDANAPNTLNLTFFSGGLGQAPWSYLTSKHPGQDLGYNEVAYLGSSGLYLGYSPVMPNYNYEILGLHPFGAGIVDANPADCIQDVLANASFGIGFPTNFIDASLQGVARAYWTANSFFISPVIEQQTAAASVIGSWLEATQVGCFWSEGLLKFIPYGDTTVVGNGVTYTPPTQPVVDLDDGDFLANEGEDPVIQTRVPWQDAYNKCGVRWTVRSNDYNEDVLYGQDDAAIDTFGLRQESPIDCSFICLQPAAQLAANLRVQRYVTFRNNYTFRINSSFAYLEPMDLVTITDTRLGLNATPVRILSIEDNPSEGLTITAEDFPWSTTTALLYPKQPQLPSNALQLGQQDPGNTDLLVFEAPGPLGLQAGNSMYIFANAHNFSGIATGGSGSNWGGCNIWISFDGINYSLLTTTSTGGRIGTLTGTLPIATDPDTVDTLSVNMANSAASLLSVSKADADNFITISALSSPAITNATYQLATATVGTNMVPPAVPYTGTAWNNVMNLGNTTAYADVSVAGGGANTSSTSGWASATGYGFTFSGTPNITGFQIDFEAQVDSLPNDGGTAAVALSIVDNTGTVVGTAKPRQITTNAATGWQGYTVSGPFPQLTEWGVNLSSANVSSTAFGVAFQAVLTNTANTIDVRVRNVRITTFTGSGQAVELISYETATLTGLNQYGLSYLRRGIYGTGIASWPTGTLFARLDSANYVYKYPGSYIGKTVYLKATSFNLLGNQQQSLSQVNALVIPLTGVAGSYDLQTGAILTPSGSVAPTWVGSMTYKATNTTITWIWNLTLYRNDGSSQVFQGSQTINGLTANTAYYFYPYVDDSRGKDKSILTMVSGVNGVGTPPWAQTTTALSASQISSSGNHIGLSSTAMIAATTGPSLNDLNWASDFTSNNSPQRNTTYSGGVLFSPGNNWTNEFAACGVPDDAFAVNTSSPKPATNYLNLLAYGFAINTTHAIFGIQADLHYQRRGAYGASDYIATLLLNDAPVTAIKVNVLNETVTLFPGDPHRVTTFGGPSDLWGRPVWTPAEINASGRAGLGVRLYIEVDRNYLAGGTIQWLVDAMSLTVYHGSAAGGTGGGFGCFSGNVRVSTVDFGIVRFDELPVDRDFLIENETGVHFARLIRHEHYHGEMIDMGLGELVTLDHPMKFGQEWVPAKVKYAGRPRQMFPTTVYNLHVITDDPASQHFICSAGGVDKVIAHNKIF